MTKTKEELKIYKRDWAKAHRIRKPRSEWKKRKSMSEELRRKIALSLTGRKLSERAKQKLSAFHTGRRRSEAHCKATSESNKRRGIRPPSRRGTIPWNYSGVDVTIQEKIRNSFEYRQWRSDVFTRDNFTCQKCGKINNNLHAHHKKSFIKIIQENNIVTFEQALACAEIWNINNGETLCGKTCHKHNGSTENGK